jgi:predicted phage baseplate assembly protein
VTSTLAVAVNGVTWSEVSTLDGTLPRDEVYVSRRADDGTVSVQFGDGVHGARPATGRQNVVARYRYGIGLAGRVGAGRLTTLLDRPTGVKNVSNLLAADGGADPQTLATARQAAPGTVRTFGRAVSLRDFEDTALLAGEVAKAFATWVWTGERRVIHLTVAAQGGSRFSPEGLARLAATLASERDPNQRLLIDNHQPVAVRIAASLQVDARHETAPVLAAARSALLDALSFERRHLAEPVFLSDIYRVLQNVDGVLSVDIDSLDLKTSDARFRAAHGVDDTLPPPQPRLLMLPARPGDAKGQVLAAELAVVENPSLDVLLTANGGIGA